MATFRFRSSRWQARVRRQGHPDQTRGLNRPGFELPPKSWTVAVPPTKRYFSAGTPPG